MASNPTPEFRAEAVRVSLTSGLPRKQVAADFGVCFSTLSRWIQQDRRNPEKPSGAALGRARDFGVSLSINADRAGCRMPGVRSRGTAAATKNVGVANFPG